MRVDKLRVGNQGQPVRSGIFGLLIENKKKNSRIFILAFHSSIFPFLNLTSKTRTVPAHHIGIVVIGTDPLFPFIPLTFLKAIPIHLPLPPVQNRDPEQDEEVA